MKLPRAVVILSLVSFLNDLASDIVVPLIPILLATILGAGPVVLGLVEGVADAVAALLKLWAGRHSDVIGGRRKALVVGGYAISNFARPLLALAVAWPMVVALRSLDRVGKGIRSAPRDAMIADVTTPQTRGRAFGFQRAFDNAGAVFGSLLAAWALTISGVSLQEVILWSALPGIAAVLLLAFGIKSEPRPIRTLEPRIPLPPLRWRALSKPTRQYLLVLGFFTFARASETFVFLRGHELKIAIPWLLVLWAGMSATRAASALIGGRLADSVGRAKVVFFGWMMLAVAFLMLANVDGAQSLVGAALAFGLALGSTEGAERAMISRLADEKEQGTAFGWYHLMVGIAAIPAGLLFGAVWQWYAPSYAFGMAAAIALSAAVWFVLVVGLKRG